jgi:hypothetical protein
MNRLQSVSRFLAAAVTSMAALFAVTTGSSNVAAADESCTVSDVDYTIVGNLFVKDTQFGAANGQYPLGAGKMSVRFESGSNGTPTHVKLMSYELDNHLTIKASFALWWTRVETRSRTFTANTPDGAAQGELKGTDLVWSTPIAGYHSDGSMECEGNVCGNYGAPPPGSSALHEAFTDVVFKPFHFSPDGKTFTMEFSKVSHSDSPKQTNFVSLSGRETKRVCVLKAPASA